MNFFLKFLLLIFELAISHIVYLQHNVDSSNHLLEICLTFFIGNNSMERSRTSFIILVGGKKKRERSLED